VKQELAVPSFDYQLLDPDVAEFVRGKAVAIARRAAREVVATGLDLIEVKRRLGHGKFQDWIQSEFSWSALTARRFMWVAEAFGQNEQIVRFAPSALYALAAKSVPEDARKRAIEMAESGRFIRHSDALEIIESIAEEQADDTPDYEGESQEVPDPEVPAGEVVSNLDSDPPPDPDPAPSPQAEGQAEEIPPEDDKPAGEEEKPPQAEGEPFHLNGTPAPIVPVSKFNRTNDMVEWALWTWNPVTGCEHNCPYCYARDIANRFYPEKFKPTFHPERLHAPRFMTVPEAANRNIGEKNVFVCSMADLFGRWVPQEWIDAVMAEVRAAPEWNFLFLTKFPLRYEGIDFPDNAWVGTSVDEQRRVANAEKAFRNVRARVKWLSCEPLRERLTFTSLEMFDWIVIGGQSKSSQEPAFQPPWEWVVHLCTQARNAGCQIYWKPNLRPDPRSRPREYPGAFVDVTPKETPK
jgi:protein gp37